jgi:putative salt-induced outer membrane protein YdiY
MPMHLIAGLCLSLFLFATAAFSQETSGGPVWTGDHLPTEYDWILLSSGEWLKGELIAMYHDNLEFDSDEMGDVTLDWSDIIELRTSEAKSLRLSDGRIFEGQLFIDANNITLYRAGSPVTIPRSDLLTLASADVNEKDLWSGNFTIGANLRSGNTQQEDYSLLIKFQRRTALTRFNNEYTGAYSSADGKQTENNHRFDSNLDYFFSEKIFFRPMSLSNFVDHFQNINYRVGYTAGVGYQIFDGTPFNWEVYTGAGWQKTYFESVEPGQNHNVDTPVLALGTDLDWDITSTIEYTFIYNIKLVNEDSGKYNSHLETGFDIDLVSDLELTIKYIWDRTEQPTADQDGELPNRDDNRIVFGLTWDY